MKYLFLFICIIISLNGFTQKTKKVTYQIGGGATISIPYKKTIQQTNNLNRSNSKEYSSNYNYFFEFMINYNFYRNLSILQGLNFHRNKFDIKFNYYDPMFRNTVPGKGILINSFFQVPILLNYRITENFSLSAGPYMSLTFLSHEEGHVYLTLYDSLYTAIDSIKIDYKHGLDTKSQFFDLGLTAQMDYKLIYSKGFSVIAFSRFNYGLVDQYINEEKDNFSNWTWRNINLMIGIGLRY